MSSRSNQVRIIAGRWRGRKLSFPDAQGLRPTPDRIRETLFNWLAPLLPGACCLDLFAGSGALGFEAASRGAARVVMLDHNPDIVRTLKLNQQLLCADGIEILQQEAGNYLSGRSGQFDLVFLDPPFKDSTLMDKSIRMLNDSASLKEGARIYLEMPARAPEPLIPESWTLEKHKKAGQVAYRLYRWRPTRSGEDPGKQRGSRDRKFMLYQGKQQSVCRYFANRRGSKKPAGFAYGGSCA